MTWPYALMIASVIPFATGAFFALQKAALAKKAPQAQSGGALVAALPDFPKPEQIFQDLTTGGGKSYVKLEVEDKGQRFTVPMNVYFEPESNSKFVGLFVDRGVSEYAAMMAVLRNWKDVSQYINLAASGGVAHGEVPTNKVRNMKFAGQVYMYVPDPLPVNQVTSLMQLSKKLRLSVTIRTHTFLYDHFLRTPEGGALLREQLRKQVGTGNVAKIPLSESEKPPPAPQTTSRADVRMSGRRGSMIENQFIGYDQVSMEDSGEGNVAMMNVFSRGPISAWDRPKYPDGSSSLTRIIGIVEELLHQWQQTTDKAYETKKALFDDARDFINQEASARGELWVIDEDLQRRLGYGDGRG